MQRWQVPTSETEPGRSFPRPHRRTLYLVLGGLVAVALLRGLRGTPAGPALARNCAHPALALAPLAVGRGHTLRYSLTGPPADAYRLLVDVTAFHRDTDGHITATPDAGRDLSATLNVGEVDRLPQCSGYGQFAAALAPGIHTLRLFVVHDGLPDTVAAAAVFTVTS